MSSKIMTYSELRASKAYYMILGVCLAVLGLGAISFFHLEHTGHYVTGMNNQIVWGLPHVFAIFLIVTASGALNISSIGTVFSKTLYQPLGRLSALLAISSLVGGLIILVLDLGHADRLLVTLTHRNLKSIFAWNIWLYSGFLALAALYLWTMMDRQMNRFYKYAGFAAFNWRLLLTMGTGSIFGFLVARELYTGAIMAPLFIALSFSLGLSVYILVLFASAALGQREVGDLIVNRLRYLLAIFIGAVLFFELARHLANLYATEKHGVELFILKDSHYAAMFWVGQIFFGSLLPLFLIFCKKLANQRWAVRLAAMLVIIGGFTQLYINLIGGQAYPLTIFPNAEVSSSFYDGEITSYSASVWEWLLGLGGVALSALILLTGLRVLRFLPESLSDDVIAPLTTN